MAQDRYDCAGEFTLRGDAGRVDLVSVGDESLPHYTLAGGVPRSRGLAARIGSGDRIERIVVRRSGVKATATVTIVDDFGPARAAVENAQWPDAPFSRAAMRRALGLASLAACCEDAVGLAPPQEDVAPAMPLPAEAAAFWQHCAACHDTPGPFPPNFLAGDARRVQASLRAMRAADLRSPFDVASAAISARQGADAAAPRVARRQPVDRDRTGSGDRRAAAHGGRVAARRVRHSTRCARDARCPATRTCARACRPVRDPREIIMGPPVTESVETGLLAALFRRRSVRAVSLVLAVLAAFLLLFAGHLWQRFGADRATEYADIEEHFKYGSTGRRARVRVPLLDLPGAAAGVCRAPSRRRLRVARIDLRGRQGPARRHVEAPSPGHRQDVPQLRGLPRQHRARRPGCEAAARISACRRSSSTSWRSRSSSSTAPTIRSSPPSSSCPKSRRLAQASGQDLDLLDRYVVYPVAVALMRERLLMLAGRFALRARSDPTGVRAASTRSTRPRCSSTSRWTSCRRARRTRRRTSRRSGCRGRARACSCTGTATTRWSRSATRARRSAPARRRRRSTSPRSGASRSGC